MKRQFLMACTFIFAVTIGTLHATPTSNPTMSRVYGNQFTPQVPDTQSAATIGTLDATFVSSGYDSLGAQCAIGSAVAVQALSDGTFLVALQGSSLSQPTVAKYNAEGTLQTSSYGTLGLAPLAALTNVQASMLDAQGRLVVAGTAASGTPVERVTADGSSVSQFTGGTWNFVSALAQQSTGKIIAVGYNSVAGNAQIARYTDGTANAAGSLDTSSAGGNTPFNGGSGVINLNGSGTLPNVAGYGVYNVVIDTASATLDQIYIAYYDTASTQLCVAGLNANGTGTTPIFVTPLSVSATPSQISLAMDLNNNLIVAAQVGNNIQVFAVTTAGVVLNSMSNPNPFTPTTITPVYTTLSLNALVTTSNGEILLIGNDTDGGDNNPQRITCLLSTGGLNTSFNPTPGTPGYNAFDATEAASPTTLYAAAIATDGQIYAVGAETSGTLQPFVYRLNNYSYVSQVAQFPAATQEQGILDQTFGSVNYLDAPVRQTFAGVNSLYNGLYGSSMMQMATAAIEVTAGSVTHGDILVGMNGSLSAAIPTYNPNPADSNMMLAWLTAEGALDTSDTGSVNIPSSGYLTLQNVTTSNEYLNAMLENGSGSVFLAGSSDTQGAFMRGYGSFISPVPSQSPDAVGGAGAQGVGISLQTISPNYRVLLCVANSSTTGSIYGYVDGVIDTNFGDAGSGSISTTSFGLHMGPSYGLVVSTIGANIYAAYLDSTSLGVCVARFQENGSHLITEFGTNGVAQDIFNSYVVAADNIRIGLLADNNLVVAAVTTTQLLIAVVDPILGGLIGSVQALTINGATSLDLARITGVSDGTAVVTFWGTTSTDKIMYVARITSGGILDITFNSQGSQQGVLPIQIGDKVANYNARSATSAIIQSTASTGYTGNIAVVGYESVTQYDATPMAMRVYGAPNTTEVMDYPISIVEQGTFDTAFDLTVLDSLANGLGKVLFAYPSTNMANAGKMLVGIDTGTSSIVARVNISDMLLDTAGFNFGGGTPGYVTLGQSGINHVSIDKSNNIVVGGTSGGAGWAAAINNAGTSSTSFNMPGNVGAVNNIGQQQSGRYIVAGTETPSGNGLLVAFQDVASVGQFQVDPTFNPLSFGSPVSSSFYVGTTGLYAMAINPNDTIAVAYSVSNVATIAEVTADGSGFVFGPTTTGVACTSSAVVQLNIDNAQNIVIGASTTSPTQLQVQRFDAAGGTTTKFNGVGVSGAGVQTIPFTGSTMVTLTGLMETTTQQTILTGWNNISGGTPANGPLFASRLEADGTLDPIWNGSATGSDYLGLLTYGSGTTPAATNVTGSAIAPSGYVYSIGSTSGTAGSSDAIVTVVFASDLIPQVSQNPLESAAGTLDTTIPNNVSGALNLASPTVLVTGVPQKIYIYNSTVNSSANGAMLIASVDNGDTPTVYVTQLNADLSLNSAHFGTSNSAISFTPNASFFTPVTATITDMYVATGNTLTAQQYIYVTGYTADGDGNSQMFAAQILPNGTGVALQATPLSQLLDNDGDAAFTGCIRQSSNGRVLISGMGNPNEDSYGLVVAYNSAMTAIDTSFGNNNGVSLTNSYGGGYYSTGSGNPIVAMATDSLDRIYIAYQAGASTINVQRLLENGTALDTSFNAGGTVTLSGTALSTTQIKLAIDLSNNQLIVAAQDTTLGGIRLARFGFDGSAAGTLNTIVVAGTCNLSDLFIDNSTLYSASPNIYVVGYTNSGNSVVARVKSPTTTSLALDTTYATTGIAVLSEGAMTVVTAAALDPDRRVYMVGSNEVPPYDGSVLGYMGRFFGDNYWTESYPAITQALVGSVDTTLSPNSGDVDSGVAGIDLVTGVTDWGLAGYTAYAVIENPSGDGSSYIAFGNLTNVVVGQLNADMIPVSSFGTGGLTAPQLMGAVSNMTIDAAGNIVVAGSNSAGTAQVVYLYNNSGTLIATFSAPTVASTVGTTVAQQKSGRYLVGGYDGSAHGLVSAYKNTSAISSLALPVDLTFGPAANNGYYPTGVNNPVDDLCIDSNDYIYIVYRNAGTVNVAKLTPEGSLVSAINTPATPTNEIWSTNPITATGITATAPARIAINNAGNILIGASTTTGVSTALYNGSVGTLINLLPQTLSNSPILTRLVGSGTDFYGSMYTTGAAAGYVFAINNSGILDTGFNSNPLQLAGQTVATTAGINGLSVQLDGKVVAVGYNGIDPILMRAYGYEYIAQFAQAPDQIAAGQLDTTLWPTTGAFLLDATSNGGFNTAIATMAIARVYEAGNGVMTFLATNGTNSIVFRLLKDLTLDTSFNSTGYSTLGNIHANALYVNPSTGNIYMAGNTGSSSWASALTSSGDNLTPSFYAGPGLATGYQILQQSTGRVILAGQGSVLRGQANTHGYLLGYTNSGALDLTFGNGTGQVDMGVVTAITDIAIDSTVYYDNIIAVANNSGTVVLKRVNAAGSVVTTLTGGTAITGAVGNPKVVFDSAGYIVVACATSSGYAVRSYNNNATATNNAALPTFTAGTTPVLSNIYATSDEKITLIGYDSATTGSTAYDAIVARLISASGSLTLDGTFNSALTGAGTPQAGVLIASLGGSASMDQFLDGIIHADDRIMVVGSNASSAVPYMARVFGDKYVSYISQAPVAATAGTLNTTFGNTSPTTGTYDDSTLNSVLVGAQGKAILPLSDGGAYQAFDNANPNLGVAQNSILIKTLADGSLDLNYNDFGGTSIEGIAGGNTVAPTYAPLGVNSILQDGSYNVLLVGTTTTSAHGWLQRYTSEGVIDEAFGTVIVTPTSSGTTSANVAVEQTLARYVVAGFDGAHAALFAYESLAPNGTPGAVDTTFNSTGAYPGRFILSSNTNAIPTLVADQYDRLIFAVLNGSSVDLYRLTPTGELDVTFGSNGKVANALINAADASQIFVALDAASPRNIVVAATSSTANTFSVAAFDNGVLTGSGANGLPIYTPQQSDISTALVGPAVTSLVTSTDGKALVLGTQTAPGAAWIARILSDGTLDTSGFDALGAIPGVFQYTGAGTVAHIYDALSVNDDGTFSMFGYEVSSGPAYVPTLVSVYNDPYVAQESQTPDSLPVGTIDPTLGVGATSVSLNAVTDGITFYGVSGTSSSGQRAEAVALYDDNNIVVAIDGSSTAVSGFSQVMINMLDNDGLLNPNFGTAGTAQVSLPYLNQYVSDMVTFTVGGVTKAIIAGYTFNDALSAANQYSSLLLQYTLTPGSQGLDSTFGGFDKNPAGVAFGDGKQAFVVGQQSTGRIVVGGLSENNLGLLLGYTSVGKLDTSFGNDGYQSGGISNITGQTGIYTHAIDNQNRIVIAYCSGTVGVPGTTVNVARMLADGSGLDTNFNVTPNITTLTSLSNIKIAVDSSNNVYVAAGAGSSIAVSSYDNGDGDLNNSVTAVVGLPTGTYTISRTIVDAANNVIVVAYDTTAQKTLVMRLVASAGSFILDTTFNTSGYILYQVADGFTSQVATDAMVHPDGRIIVVGSEA